MTFLAQALHGYLVNNHVFRPIPESQTTRRIGRVEKAR